MRVILLIMILIYILRVDSSYCLISVIGDLEEGYIDNLEDYSRLAATRELIIDSLGRYFAVSYILSWSDT